MKGLTHAQTDMLLAEQLVTEAAELGEKGAPIYGGLCHSFPVLVRTCGLCQALAFHKAKASSGSPDRAAAHGRLLAHIGRILGAGDDPLHAVRNAPAAEYMLHTRRVLAAWIYFKRFAESILNVSGAGDAEESSNG